MVNKREILSLAWKTAIGCGLFALSFNLFLAPNGLNAGGISGLAMSLVHLFGHGSVGLLTALINLPLFVLAGLKVGRKFFIGSIMGMLLSSVMIDAFSFLAPVQIDPLMASVCGGVLSGAGLGLVFSAGGSTGGSDIVVRLLKKKWQDVPIGTITILLDLGVVIFTGIVYGNVANALYCTVTIFFVGRVVDGVVYRFDYSKVALIVSKEYLQVAQQIGSTLHRGATFLNGEGCYSRMPTKVVLTAVKRQQITELKQLVNRIDPDAFIILQDAHQVLGDGFLRYSKDAL